VTATEKIEEIGVNVAKAFGFNAKTTKEIEEAAFIAWGRVRGCFGTATAGANMARNLANIAT
jgi:hypothetical protein